MARDGWDAVLRDKRARPFDSSVYLRPAHARGHRGSRTLDVGRWTLDHRSSRKAGARRHTRHHCRRHCAKGWVRSGKWVGGWGG